MDSQKTSVGFGIGMLTGTAIGVLTDNLQLWLPLGIAIGAGLAATFGRSNAGDSNGDSK